MTQQSPRASLLKRLLPAAVAVLLGAAGSAAADRAASPIADAAMKGDAAAVANLIDQRADVNAAQTDGATALHWAVYRGDVATATALLKAGASVKQPNREGVTPLSLACQSGNVDVVRLLLDAGADPNETLPNGETALMMAARTGNPEPLLLLIERGANVNAAETLRGTTPLMWAAANEHPAAVRVLLEHGADAGARSKVIPRGRRPYLAPTVQSRINEFVQEIGQAGRRVQGDSRLGDVPPEDPREAARLAAQRERALKQLAAAPGPAAVGGSDEIDEAVPHARGESCAGNVGRRHAARVRRAPGRPRVGKAAARARRRHQPADRRRLDSAARGRAEPLLPARIVSARARRRSENPEQGRLEPAVPRDRQPQHRGRRLPHAQARHGPPRDHQAAARARRRREHAHALEHRDAHDFHAPVVLRRRRDRRSCAPRSRAMSR